MRKLERTMLLIALFASVGCNAEPGAELDGGTGGEAGGGAGGEANEGPSRVRCEFFFRESNEDDPPEPPSEFVSATLEVGANGSGSAGLGLLTFSVSYSDDEFEGASVSIVVTANDEPLSRFLYQFPDRELPDNQFDGGHGFTGLVYLTHPVQGGDYQLFCNSVE